MPAFLHKGTTHDQNSQEYQYSETGKTDHAMRGARNYRQREALKKIDGDMAECTCL